MFSFVVVKEIQFYLSSFLITNSCKNCFDDHIYDVGCCLCISDLSCPCLIEQWKTILFKVGDVCVDSVSSIFITTCFDKRLLFSFVYSFHKRHLHIIAKLLLGNCDRSNHFVGDIRVKTSNSTLNDASQSEAGKVNEEVPYKERGHQQGFRGLLFRGVL